MTTPTLEEKTKAETVMQCEQKGCHQEFTVKDPQDVHYIPKVACPTCYEQWFYQQD